MKHPSKGLSRRMFLQAAAFAGAACSSDQLTNVGTSPDGAMPPDSGPLPDGGAPTEGPDVGADAALPVPTPPRAKYMFQQALLFQRAHVQSMTVSYVNRQGQTIAVALPPAKFDGSDNEGANKFGSTSEELCAGSARPWANVGGDWIDAADKPQGSTPFATGKLVAKMESVESVDVTAALTWIFARKHWCALFLKFAGGEVSLVGVLNPNKPKPYLELTFADGKKERLDCWYTASLRASTSYTNAQDSTIAVSAGTPAVLEFYRVDDPNTRVSSIGQAPTSAMLYLPHLGVLKDEPIEVYVVNPPVPKDLTPIAGIAAGFRLDAGILSNEAVAAALCVTDEMTISDALDEAKSGSSNNPWLADTDPYGQRSEAVMDPYLWTKAPGQGDFKDVPVPSEAQRAALYPRRVHSAKGTKLSGSVARKKGTMPGDALRHVRGDDALAKARGFTPLAPGLGALEFLLGGGSVKNGQSTLQSATNSNDETTDLDMWFREQHAGRVIDGYMRMYVLLGDGWDASEDGTMHQFYAPVADSKFIGKFPEELGVDPNKAFWRRLDRTGKFIGGIQQQSSYVAFRSYVDPTRKTSQDKVTVIGGGAYSSTSGLYGYQGRWMFRQGYYKPGTPGPAVGGLALGIELYDFNGGNQRTSPVIPSQSSVGGWDASWRSFATHVGGLGFLYPRKWYCVEMRWRMNSTKPYALPPEGTHALEGGHNVDGFVEWWIDGVPAAKTPLFAHRSSAAIIDWALQNSEGVPFDTEKASPARLRPMTNVPPELFMGAASAVFNFYYGGRTFNESNKYVYINGIVCSSGAYIGPMAGVSRDNGGLG
jgi:hypothetical protein